MIINLPNISKCKLFQCVFNCVVLKFLISKFIVKNLKILILFSILTLTFQSCASDYFRLNFHHPDRTKLIVGRIFSDNYKEKEANVLNVDVINENTLSIDENTKVALKFIDNIEYQADFTIEMLNGENIIIYLRTFYDNFSKNPKIKLLYNQKGVYLYEYRDGGEYLIAQDLTEKLEKNEKKRFFIKNDGKRLKVLIDCADIFDVRTNLNISQYLIFETEKNTKYSISGIDFMSIR